ncbi:MAG: helix-turn-helix domain-containing protein [Gammaproteobacteria bacterium]
MIDAMQHQELIGIGELAKRTGSKVETIRYYEHQGLLPEPMRTAGGHRVYDTDGVKRLTFIRRSRELGFSIAEIEQLLTLVGHNYTCHDIREITMDHLETIQRKIDDLQRLERVLTEMASQCSDDQTPECPIIDALYAQAEH